MPKVNVKMETEAKYGAVVGVKKLKFDAKGEAEIEVDAESSQLLVWWLMGSPGAKYKITLSTSSKVHKIKIETPGWENPIESAISTHKFDTSGHARFSVVKK